MTQTSKDSAATKHDQSASQPSSLADLLKNARQEQGLTLQQLSDQTGIDDGLLSRMETGKVLQPSPEKLELVAKALKLPLADLYSLTGYALPKGLPSPAPYLRAKYRTMPKSEMEKLTKEINAVLNRYGISEAGGPKPGQDE